MKQKRIPRPLGLTLQLRTLNQTQNTEEKEKEFIKIKYKIIEQWTSNGMMLNNRLTSLEDMSKYLNISTESIMKYVWKALGKMGKVIAKKDVGDIAREIFGWAFKKNLEIEAHLGHQAKLLVSQQDGQYVPFLTSAANQALANWNGAQTSVVALMRLLMDKQEVNPITNTTINQTTNNYITTKDAMNMLMQKEESMFEQPEMADRYLPSIPEGLPNLNPNTQDLSKILKPKLEPIQLPSKARKSFIPNHIEDAEDFQA